MKEINNGGTHEANPFGGVPMGVNPQGQPIRYEEGETAVPTPSGEYVFSDRLPITRQVVQKLKLPKSLEGKSFADASKYINNKFKERNDKISNSTKDKFLGELQASQEETKLALQAKTQEAMAMNSTTVPDTMGGQIPQGMEQFFFGGNSSSGEEAVAAVEGGSGGFSAEGAIAAVPGVLAMGNEMFGSKENVQSSPDMVTGIVGGASSGAALGTSILPGWGTAIGAAVGGLSGAIGSSKAKKRAEAEVTKRVMNAHNATADNYAVGGFNDRVPPNLNLTHGYGSVPQVPTTNKPEPFFDLQHNAVGHVPGLGSAWAPMNNALISPKRPSWNGGETELEEMVINIDRNPSTPNLGRYQPPAISANLGKSNLELPTVPEETPKNPKNKAGLLRYAPVALNALQYFNAKKPSVEMPDIDMTKARRDYMDTEEVVRRANANTNSAMNQLSQAGMSGGALRNSVIAGMLNRGQTIGEAAVQAEAINRTIDANADQLDAQTRDKNANRRAVALDGRRRDLAAYNTERSKLLDSIGTDLGEIGLEATRTDAIGKAYGYTVDGDYIKTPTGEKLSFVEAAKKHGQEFVDWIRFQFGKK